MIEYSRSHTKKVDSSFDITPYRLQKKKAQKLPFRLIDAMDLGIYFVVPLLVGVGVGVLVKQVILGLVLGTVGCLFNLYKIVREFSKNA